MSKAAEQVRRVIAERLGPGRIGVIDEAKFHEDFDADSLDLVEVVMAIEDEFDIEVTDDEAEAWKAVVDVVRLVEARTQ